MDVPLTKIWIGGRKREKHDVAGVKGKPPTSPLSGRSDPRIGESISPLFLHQPKSSLCCPKDGIMAFLPQDRNFQHPVVHCWF